MTPVEGPDDDEPSCPHAGLAPEGDEDEGTRRIVRCPDCGEHVLAPSR